MSRIDRSAYASMFGPTTGDRVRLGDTALLIQVEQAGAACHEGYKSCFFRSVGESDEGFSITEPQLSTPDEIYGKKK